jgi:glycerol uptake facilitator-like aquaporin
VFFVEMIGTAVFVSLIMAIKYYTPSKNGPLGGLSIAMTLYGMILVTGKVSGGCLNPAVAFSAIITQFSPFVTLYFFATLVGGIIAGVISGFNDKVHKLGD